MASDPQWGNRGKDGPPDLDEIWRKLTRQLKILFGGQGGGTPPPPSSGDESVAKRAGIIAIPMHASHIARHDTCFEPSRQSARGFCAFSENMQRNQFKLTDRVTLAVDEGVELSPTDFELSPRFFVTGFPKPCELFEPIHALLRRGLATHANSGNIFFLRTRFNCLGRAARNFESASGPPLDRHGIVTPTSVL